MRVFLIKIFFLQITNITYRISLLQLLLQWAVLIFNSEKPPKKVTYSWWSRLWRIYNYLKRQKKKRKEKEKQNKKKRREESQKQRKFERRKKWRKLKVILKSGFRKKRHTPQQKIFKQRQKFLRKWNRRRRHRIFWVFIKSLGKKKIVSPQKKERIKLIQAEKSFEKYRKKRRKRFVLKRQKEIIIDVLKGKGLPESRKKKGPSLWKQIWLPKQLIITINSLLFFLLSYFFIAFFDKLSMGITALLFDYKTVIYYYNIEFLVDYDAWYADAVKAIFATGPIVGLFIGILSLIIYSKVYLENGILKLLLLWAIFHGFNRIISGALVGSMLSKGFGYVIIYMYYSDTGKLILALIVLMLSVIVGSLSAKFWVMSANSYYNYSKLEGRALFLLNQIFLPYVFGNIIIYFITQPKTEFLDTLVNVFMIFMILPPLLLYRNYQDYYFDEEPRSIKISIPILIFAIIFIASFRYFLDFGLRLG